MRLWLIFPLFWWLGEPTPAAEVPLTPVEAQAAFQRARPEPPPAAGFFEQVETKRLKRTTTTTVTTEWREPGRPTWRRSEKETRRIRGGALVSRSVRVTNAEGSWVLLDTLAVKMPRILSPEASRKVVNESLAIAKQDVERLKAEGKANDPAARAELLEKYMKFSGVRITEPGAPAKLRVRMQMGPEGVKMMRTMIDEAWKQQKKELSFGLRLIVTPIYAAKRDDYIPVAQESLIDDASGKLIEQTLFNAAGKPITDPRASVKSAWKPVAPLPASAFEIPAGLTRHEAKSLAELSELQRKHPLKLKGGSAAKPTDEKSASLDNADDDAEMEVEAEEAAPAKP